MKDPKVLIGRSDSEYVIKVQGRATFDSSIPLRSLAVSLNGEDVKRVCVDLSGCLGMDSTFMGVLAMIGLKMKRSGLEMQVFNADENCRKLLNGLGLNKLFSYAEKPDVGASAKWTEPKEASGKMEKAETVLEAHQTLMEVDKSNVPKFKNVVEFVKKDMEEKGDK